MPELLQILEEGKTDQWYAFVWLEESLSMGISVSRMETLSDSMDRGMVFRILANGRNYEQSTNDLDEGNLRKLAREFRDSVESQSSVPGLSVDAYRPLSWEEELTESLSNEIRSLIPVNVTPSDEVHFAPVCRIDPYTTTPSLLAKRARELREELIRRSDEYVSNHALDENPPKELADARVMIRQLISTNVFVDRTRNISQTLPVSLSYIMGVSPKGLVGRAVIGGTGGLEVAEPDNESFREAAIVPHLLDRASRIKPGRYRVITGPDVTGVIAHEAFGHTQEGDTCAKGRSIAPGLRKDGVKVGNDQASIINYAGVFNMEDEDHGSNGSYYFDHEGQLSRPQAILDKGYLSTPMTDLLSASYLKVPRTANGKRESWRRPMMTRQTNTYFTPGDKTLMDMIEMVENGFLARHAHGGMEDPKGGSLTAGTEYLEEIKNGKLTGQIFLGPNGGHVELSDPVFTLLDRIEAKSSTRHPEGIPLNKYGGCGKYHKESVPAGSGGPFILWQSLNCG